MKGNRSRGRNGVKEGRRERERERLGMEGKEGKGGRDAGQDKRINTEGSK